MGIKKEVFQEEIIAIYQSMLFIIHFCKSQTVSYLKILCDSQAAILALDSKDLRSQAVQKTVEALNTVAELTVSGVG